MTSRTLALLSVVFFLLSCTASQHAGVLTVPRPASNEPGEAKWFAYYQDLFDGYEGNVEPLGPDAPEPVRRGYERAKVEWENKEANAKWRTFLVAVPVGIVIGVLVWK